MDNKENVGPVFRLLIPADSLTTKGNDDLIHHTGNGVQQGVDHERDDNHGHEAGQNDRGIVELQGLIGTQEVEHQGKTHCGDQAGDDEADTVEQGIPHGTTEFLRLQEELQVTQTVPVGGPDAVNGLKVLKTDDDHGDRQGPEKKNSHQAGEDHPHHADVFGKGTLVDQAFSLLNGRQAVSYRSRGFVFHGVLPLSI